MNKMACLLFAAGVAHVGMGAEIDLSGTWKLDDFGYGKEPISCPIAVPGDVQTALYEAKLIPDPFWGRNELSVRWVGQSDWKIARTFSVGKEFLDAGRVTLEMDEVDTFATIYVNGQEVGRTDNRFKPWRFDVTQCLKPGENEILGVFESAERISAGEPIKYEHYIPCFSNGVVTTINYIRKPQCHGGWDWGICQMVMGFCGKVKLVNAEKPIIDYVWCDQKFNDDYSNCQLTVYVEYTRSDGVKATKVETRTIDNPPLWWPNGMGERRFYDLSIDVEGVRVEKRIGLRKVEMVNEADVHPVTGEKGLSCYFRVNGRRVFAKGVNWIPCDAFENRQTPARYRNLLESAARANMNMIRVWGGGVYEKDVFYDLCDDLGLMVWQDFMFACGNYPVGKFLDSVEDEAVHQVKRLRDHASIVLWCGDNECRGPILEPWQYVKDNRDWYFGNYAQREARLASVVRRCDPSRTFWSTSPSNGPGEFGQEVPDMLRGDIHFWGVWHGGASFSRFNALTPRFVSEFGFQSFPSRETAETFCKGDAIDLTSGDFGYHQKCEGGNEKIISTMKRYFKDPKDVDATLYLSQVQQALAIKTAIEAWRPQMPWCMGTLYWQLNDNWPVSSWSSIEYGGKWKHLHYHAKRFFAPIAVMGVEGKGIYAVSDRASRLAAKMTVERFDFSGRLLAKETKDLLLEPDSSVKVAELPAVEDRTGSFLLLTLETSEGRFVNDFFFTEYKNCALGAATVRAEVKAFEVTLTTDVPAFFVWADAPGCPGEFDDNSLTLVPGRPVKLTFTPRTSDVTPEKFRAAFRLTHLQEATR